MLTNRKKKSVLILSKCQINHTESNGGKSDKNACSNSSPKDIPTCEFPDSHDRSHQRNQDADRNYCKYSFSNKLLIQHSFTLF